MRKAILLIASALLMGGLLPATSLADANGSDLPVRGSNSGYLTVNLATGQGHAITTGQISHFGATTVEQDTQSVPTGPTTNSFTGTWTLTVANGDTLFGTSSGTSSRPDSIHATIVGHYVSTGGTGRLAEASVTMDVSVAATVLSVDGSVATQAVAVTIRGRLSH